MTIKVENTGIGYRIVIDERWFWITRRTAQKLHKELREALKN